MVADEPEMAMISYYLMRQAVTSLLVFAPRRKNFFIDKQFNFPTPQISFTTYTCNKSIMGRTGKLKKKCNHLKQNLIQSSIQLISIESSDLCPLSRCPPRQLTFRCRQILGVDASCRGANEITKRSCSACKRRHIEEESQEQEGDSIAASPATERDRKRRDALRSIGNQG